MYIAASICKYLDRKIVNHRKIKNPQDKDKDRIAEELILYNPYSEPENRRGGRTRTNPRASKLIGYQTITGKRSRKLAGYLVLAFRRMRCPSPSRRRQPEY